VRKERASLNSNKACLVTKTEIMNILRDDAAKKIEQENAKVERKRKMIENKSKREQEKKDKQAKKQKREEEKKLVEEKKAVAVEEKKEENKEINNKGKKKRSIQVALTAATESRIHLKKLR